jgi:hypothetical protein
MKNSISREAWEKKKEVIANLYVKEDWPAMQVIKRIRSDGFNPRYAFILLSLATHHQTQSC